MAAGAYLELDAARLRADLGRRPFLVGHRLVGHPLLELPRLVALARALPAEKIEYNAGDVPMTLDPSLTPHTGLSPEETLRRIAECRSWLVLKNVELDGQYRRLLHECLEEVRASVPALTRGMRDLEGFVFVSSPGARTPYHMDPEENFLLQVAGTKHMHVVPPQEGLPSAQEIERFLTGAHRNLVFREEYRPRAQRFALTPGLGVHVPVTAPHWVENGDEVSVSFSITWQTADTFRRSHAHRFNARLRRLGIEPAPVGASAMRDRLKHYLHRAGKRLSAVLPIPY